jgi:hypothetical protein
MSLLLKGAGRDGEHIVSGGPELWTPDEEAGLIAWFDVADLGNYNTTTDIWSPRWGSLELEASGAGPTTTTTGFSGNKNALVFTDSSNTGLVIANPGFDECVVAMALNIVTPAESLLVWNRALSGIEVAGLLFGSTYGIYVRYGSSNPSPNDYSFAMPGQHLTVTRHSNNSRIIRYDGTTKVTDSVVHSGTEPATTDSFELFRDGVSDFGYVVQCAAIGIFTDASWSTTLAEKIEGYICHNNLGHTTAQLPGGHPYKTTAPTV